MSLWYSTNLNFLDFLVILACGFIVVVCMYVLECMWAHLFFAQRTGGANFSSERLDISAIWKPMTSLIHSFHAYTHTFTLIVAIEYLVSNSFHRNFIILITYTTFKHSYICTSVHTYIFILKYTHKHTKHIYMPINLKSMYVCMQRLAWGVGHCPPIDPSIFTHTPPAAVVLAG